MALADCLYPGQTRLRVTRVASSYPFYLHMLPPSLVSFINNFMIHIFSVLSLFANTPRIPRENSSIYWPWQTVLMQAKTRVASSSPFYLRRLPAALLSFVNHFMIHIYFSFMIHIFLALSILETVQETQKTQTCVASSSAFYLCRLPPSLASFNNHFVIRIFLVLPMLENTLIIPREKTSIYWPSQTIFTLSKLSCK